MIVISGLSPKLAYLRLLRIASQNIHSATPSRIGPMIDLGCVCVELSGGERLITLPGRAINPAFAVAEAAWVITGSNQVAPLQKFISNYDQYSDDGLTLNGAYGHRLRHFFGVDQISLAAAELKAHCDTRRVVLSVFSPSDLSKQSNDIPCNTQIILRSVDGRLDMNVVNRSNDLWLGVPYNWFVFRVIQARIANEAGLLLGIQRHFSSCLHLYCKDLQFARKAIAGALEGNYLAGEGAVVGIDPLEIIEDAQLIVNGSFQELKSNRLRTLFALYEEAKDERARHAIVDKCDDTDVLQLTLAHWIAARANHRNQCMTTEKSMSANPHEEPIQMALQRCVFSQPTDVLLPIVRHASQRLTPKLPAMLSKGLPAGVTAQIDQGAVQSLSVQVALEVLLGTLDDVLHKTPMGDRFVERLQEIAVELGLEGFVRRSRDCSAGELKELFGDLPAPGLVDPLDAIR